MATILGERRDDVRLLRDLDTQIRSSDQRMKHFVDSRKEALEKYAGYRYSQTSQSGAQRARPMNMIWTAASVYVPLLVMRNPKFRVRTGIKEHHNTAWLIQEDLCQTMKELDFAAKYEEIVIDALFFMGIAKTGLMHGDTIDLERATGMPMPEGEDGEIEIPELFFKRVSAEDFFVDPKANHMRDAEFMGDKYEVRLDYAEQWYDTKLKPERSDERRSDVDTGDISGRGDKDNDDLFDRVQLADVYFPEDEIVVTFAPNQIEKGPLAVADWSGYDNPYDILSFHYIPDQLFPNPPVNLWMELDKMINTAARRLERKSEREKQVIGYVPEAAEDVDTLQKARDGTYVKLAHMDGIQEFQLGGNTERTEGFLNRLMSIFSQQSGNTDLLGGLGSGKTQTATEASMLGRQATLRVEDMIHKVESFAQRIGKRVALFRWDDPFANRPLVEPVRIAGMDLEVDTYYGQGTREGAWEEYDLEIVPYSMRGRNPEEYAHKKFEWFTRVVMPLLELGIQQGVTLDFAKFITDMAEEMGIDQSDRYFSAVDDLMKQAMKREGGGPARTGGDEAMRREAAEQTGEPMDGGVTADVPDDVAQMVEGL